ncbi:methyl-accepting chemotaxis protein [Massilia rubra]|uniref:HAMP domain-containing protein n=1 Tax=Massilia rubra TaxID=2607910 RepID=A0ABX0LGA6_9BURK|nr:methyl-accepting chemotaxis protein [Massilia rubra]NHZ33638.1 HAMP domain-containing protein [Massilia rubra]
MLKNYSIRIIFTAFFLVSVALSVCSLMAFARVSTEQDKTMRASENRYQSFLLADELRQSSDDLTRLARTFVVSGDAAYERQYMDILDIRNGAKPRPQHYERIYWDFVAAGVSKPTPDGQAVALADLMRKAGFTDAEFAKLKQAQDNSDALVKTEVIAMNAVKGLFDDGAGKFTQKREPDMDLARKIMHDADYHKNKATIMKPVNEFLAMLDQRTSEEVRVAASRADTAFWTAIGTLGVSLAMSLATVLLIYRHIKAGFGQAIDTASKIASGDLNGDAVEERSDEVGQLLQSMNTISTNLRQTVHKIRESSDEISAATHDIAVGNADLSARTESQASSLEETASSMEELTSTVRQNADNARQANLLAASASEVAIKGGAVVAQVVDTMGSINESARKIVDIISVIDSIAFQTNILALNAAVEAARAGEQGRGFAVVASEVRNLAQRSAGAAKEIKALINDSVDKVDLGSKLVDHAGATMNDVVASIGRVSTIVGEIATASLEQSSGIEQVNQAIVQMDALVQSNSSLVEEAAAAAESLEEQAGNLVETVKVFKVDAPGQGRAAAPKTTMGARKRASTVLLGAA